MKTYASDGMQRRSIAWGKNFKKINNSQELQNELNERYRKGVNRTEVLKIAKVSITK